MVCLKGSLVQAIGLWWYVSFGTWVSDGMDRDVVKSRTFVVSRRFW
jgi:hypothetical protein